MITQESIILFNSAQQVQAKLTINRKENNGLDTAFFYSKSNHRCAFIPDGSLGHFEVFKSKEGLRVSQFNALGELIKTVSMTL